MNSVRGDSQAEDESWWLTEGLICGSLQMDGVAYLNVFLFCVQLELENVNGLLTQAEVKNSKSSKDLSSTESQLQDAQVQTQIHFLFRFFLILSKVRRSKDFTRIRNTSKSPKASDEEIFNNNGKKKQ